MTLNTSQRDVRNHSVYDLSSVKIGVNSTVVSILNRNLLKKLRKTQHQFSLNSVYAEFMNKYTHAYVELIVEKHSQL